MSKAIGWAVIIMLVLLAGTHPGTLVHILQDFIGILERAGNELVSFINKL